jgi:hypothetical protein
MPRSRPSPSRQPRRTRIRRTWLVVAVLGLALAVLGWLGSGRGTSEGEPIGLFTTLPILWADSAELGAELRPDAAPHWALKVFAAHGKIEPLDQLTTTSLAGLRRLVIAQPRPLGPAENVALDDWVRGGGHVLLLADPALTQDSAFAIGDPRRPQAVALLSPILGRWELDLLFDDSQVMGESSREVLGLTTPVNLPGRFATRGQANCRLWADGLAVTCVIGKGRVVALADAAVLEPGDPSGLRPKAFAGLLDAAFAAR